MQSYDVHSMMNLLKGRPAGFRCDWEENKIMSILSMKHKNEDSSSDQNRESFRLATLIMQINENDYSEINCS